MISIHILQDGLISSSDKYLFAKHADIRHKKKRPSYDGLLLVTRMFFGVFDLALPMDLYEVPEVLVAKGNVKKSCLRDSSLPQCPLWSGR